MDTLGQTIKELHRTGQITESTMLDLLKCYEYDLDSDKDTPALWGEEFPSAEDFD